MKKSIIPIIVIVVIAGLISEYGYDVIELEYAAGLFE